MIYLNALIEYPMRQLEELIFRNTYASLGEDYYSCVQPSPFEDLQLAAYNPLAAQLLDLSPDQYQRAEFVRYLTGQQVWQGTQPLAMLYAGHQFGVWVPQLGDGRAVMLGQVENQRGDLWELQLKGSGPTPYSRGADGRAVLRSSIREYLCSEAMQGLGIATTRALALFASDAPVYREQVETAAILLRMAPSHIRFGSFEVFYHRGQQPLVRKLADHVIDIYYPELRADSEPVAALFNAIVDRTAKMIAQWQAVGFAHGVMNSDNMSILGLTIDYGPFGFMEAYQPGWIGNHSDYRGRYAFNQQPNIAMWNLLCLGSTLLPEMGEETARSIVERFPSLFAAYYEKLMFTKLGLVDTDDEVLLAELLAMMQHSAADYTMTFRRLSRLDSNAQASVQLLQDLFIDRERFDNWLSDYIACMQQQGIPVQQRIEQLCVVNPKYVLRNYMAEIAIRKAKEKDYSEIKRLLSLLHNPFAEHEEYEEYAGLPPDWASKLEVSCSS